MKKLIILLVIFFSITITSNVIAADVVVTITIPDAYVTRLSNMITDKYINAGHCEGLTVKQCFVQKVIIDSIKVDLLAYEKDKIGKTASDAAISNINEIKITSQD